MFCQNADGSWKPSVLPLLMEDSVDTLRARQTAVELAGLEVSVMLTLAAVKALQTKFADKKQETKLVILKAFVYLR